MGCGAKRASVHGNRPRRQSQRLPPSAFRKRASRRGNGIRATSKRLRLGLSWAKDRDDADVAGGIGIPGVGIYPIQDAVIGHDELPMPWMVCARWAEMGVGAEFAQGVTNGSPLPRRGGAGTGLGEPLARTA